MLQTTSRNLALATLACLSILLPARSEGSFTVFTDRAAFALAAGGGASTTETFGTAQSFVVGNNFYNGVNYQITGTGVGGNGISGGVLNGDEFTPYSLNFVLPNPVVAFGADFNGANTASGLTFTILGQTFSLGSFLPSPGTGFLGFVSTDAFTVVDVGSGPPSNEIYSLDNLTYVRAAAAVPEPSSLALCGVGGLMGIGLARARRKRPTIA